MMDERESAIRLANVILDQHWRDPDDDCSVLARQLLRTREEADRLRDLIRRRLDCDGSNGTWIAHENFTTTAEMNAVVNRILETPTPCVDKTISHRAIDCTNTPTQNSSQNTKPEVAEAAEDT